MCGRGIIGTCAPMPTQALSTRKPQHQPWCIYTYIYIYSMYIYIYTYIHVYINEYNQLLNIQRGVHI